MSLMSVLVVVDAFSQLNDAIHKICQKSEWVGSRVNKLGIGEKFERLPRLRHVGLWNTGQRKGGGKNIVKPSSIQSL